MQKFARHLMLLALLVFTASPLVDCCLSGHAQAETPPPCHGEAQHSSPAPADHADDAGCGGCVNCAGAQMHASQLLSKLIVVGDDESDLTALPSTRTNAPTRLSTGLATGPPQVPTRPATTLLTLKQQLLI